MTQQGTCRKETRLGDSIVHLALGGLFLFAAVADVTARVNPRPHLP